MKKNLFILLLITSQLSFTTFGDSVPKNKKRPVPTNCPAPASSVGSSLVNTRLGIYADKKKTSKQMNLRDEIPYDPAGFEQLLKDISDKSAGYDGFRTYFACYPSMQVGQHPPVDSGWAYVPPKEFGQVALIFVPTRADKSKGKHYHGDDLTHCLVINGTTVQAITPAIASLWIKKAEATYLRKFETTRQNTSSKFKETHSLWYSIDLVVSNGGDKGLLDYLECRIANHNIDAVNAKIGGFGLFNVAAFKSYHYKLTLIFNFHSVSLVGDDYESLFILDFKDKFKKMHGFTDGDTDTGKPCPPPDCNSQGSLLPQ